VPNVYGLVGGDANAVGPNKRPLSSMSPTIVVKDGKTWLVTGSPGGSRIITTVLQMVVNSIDYGMNVAEATNAPRFHYQWLPDELRVEKGFSPDTLKLL
ncbi:gamma-glutamyltransferase, partial [Escherichia coli]|nr:gamma-glutamyltransferase [Escherichia coli]